MKSSFTRLTVLLALFTIPFLSHSQEICYTIADAGDKLYTLNPTTGAISLVGATGVGNTESSALNNAGDTLFTANGNIFGWINLSTGAFTQIDTIGSLQNGPEGTEAVVDIDAMTTDVDGNIWAVERKSTGDLIFKINRVTGQPIANAFGLNVDYLQVQSSGTIPTRLDAIAIDPTTGILYASANNQSSSADDNYIVTINKTNGMTTSIGLPGVGDIEGMSFTSTGQMIVVTGKSGSDLFYHIDKTDATSTEISTFSTDSDYETCACAGQLSLDPNTISGHVFSDLDNDGVLDSADVLWQNVTINLFEDSDCDGNKDTGSAIQTVQTNQNGFYEFMVDGVVTTTSGNSSVFQINHGDLDVEESASGSITMSSSDLDIDINDKPLTGLRFLNTDVPQGATITNAYIQFYADESDASTSNAQIYGMLSTNAPAFSSSSNDLSGRTSTTATVSWDIEAWSTGNAYDSPDLTSILQEIVNQGGWVANNAVVLIVEHLSGDDRQAESYEGSSTKAAILVVQYSTGSGSECYYIEIDQGTIPSGSSLTTNAYETASFSGSGQTDDNNDFGFYQAAPAVNKISGTVFSDANNNGVLNTGEGKTQNVTVELYTDGNCDGMVNGMDAKVDEEDSDVNGYYEFERTFACSGSSSGTFSSRITASANDAEETSSGSVSLSSHDLDLGDQFSAVRYEAVTIPNGATITSATLTFTSRFDKSSTTSFSVYGEKTIDANAFTHTTYDLSGRAKTTASVTWNPAAWTTGNTYTSPSLTNVIQEIVDQSGWETSNALVLLMPDITGQRSAWTFDESQTLSPLLEITYTTSTCTECYTVKVVEGDLPTGSTLTTASSYDISFTSSGNHSMNNDFGYFSPSTSGYTCYTISDANDALYSINPTTGASIFIGYTGVGNLESSTLSFDGDTLYSTDGDDFGWVNLSTGVFTTIADIGTLQNGPVGAKDVVDIDAMATGVDNSIYAVERYTGGDLIFKISPSTGTYIPNAFGPNMDYIQLSTPSGVSNRLDAIGVDPITGVMYASANGQSSSASNNNIITIDLSTGVGTLLGNAGVGDLEGMTVTQSGQILATSGKDGSNTNNLYEISKVDGSATLIGALGGTDFETCACPGQDLSANTIIGTVFSDENLNGIEDNGEAGQSGVSVKLYVDVNQNGIVDAGDSLVETTTSDGLGNYIFNVAYTSGTDYFVVETVLGDYPTGTSLTTDNIETAVFSSGGNVDANNDFGFAASNVISGTVFLDPNRNGVFETGEGTSANRTIQLYQDENCNGIVDGADSVVATTTTDANGFYQFDRAYVCNQSSGTEEVSISSGGDDALESTSGSMNLTRTSLRMDYNVYPYLGLRFNDVTIPIGATITEAYVEFEAEGGDGGTASINIYGEDADNASAFSTDTNDLSGRVATTADVLWSPEAWTTGDLFQTPELKSIVQEIVDRSGWAEDNSIALMFNHLSGDDREAEAFEASGANAKIVIKYTVSSTCNDCYVIFFDDSQLTNDSTMTTSDIQTAQFSSGGNTDPNNDFGYFYKTAVPVELIHFSGRMVNDYAELIWVTASEINNDYYDVQRSADGITFKTIGRIGGKGTTNEITNYTYNDYNTLPGTSYYRLKQVDFNGEFEYHGPVVINKNALTGGDIKVFPNPTTDMIHVEFNTRDIRGVIGTVSIYDVQGRLIRSTEMDGRSVSLQVNDLPRGIYKLEYKSAQTHVVKPFVIERK